MLQLINDLPPYITGVRATGEVTKQDIETVLLPAIDRIATQYDNVHYLLVLETDIKNWTAGAWLSDAWAGLKHITKWMSGKTKIALVTDQEGVRKVNDVAGKFVPGEIRSFKVTEIEAAKAWITEREQD